MHTLKIYGASDDLIEIEGDIEEEFTHYGDVSDGGVYLAISDGTVLKVKYDDGVWRITPAAPIITTFEKTEGVPGDDNYSDTITLKSLQPFKWIVCGSDLALAKQR